MNNKGDLISREALKEKLKERYYNDGLNIVTAIELIDNSPTVETLKDITEVHCDITKEQLLNALRPQGEWIKGKEIAKVTICDKEFSEYRDFTCSNCRITLDNLLYWDDGSPVYKFCPNCGAKMKGGAE